MYVRVPKAARWSDQLRLDVMHDSIMVDEGPELIETGLLDVDGCPLARVREPIGFRRD